MIPWIYRGMRWWWWKKRRRKRVMTIIVDLLLLLLLMGTSSSSSISQHSTTNFNTSTGRLILSHHSLSKGFSIWNMWLLILLSWESIRMQMVMRRRVLVMMMMMMMMMTMRAWSLGNLYACRCRASTSNSYWGWIEMHESWA
jgi:hypothetical protein